MSEFELFDAARKLTDPAARAAFLDQACQGDLKLRNDVEALLHAHDAEAPFLESVRTESMEREAEDADRKSEQDRTDAAVLSRLMPPDAPEVLALIDHYALMARLGQGNFGIVFRAIDRTLERTVAIKIMAPELASTSPARKRFLREARTAAAIRNEHVVNIYSVGDEPLPYLVMEYIPGQTLQDRLNHHGPLDLEEVLRLGQQIAIGLAAAHAINLVHRDLKPSNILLESGTQVRAKITDFGLARAVDDASVTQSGMIAGTPLYMAPEQAQGKTVDQRADLFSLGSVLYVMLSGRPPFRAPTVLAVLKRVAEDQPRPIREIIPDAPEWLCEYIATLHEKDPARRPQTALAVAEQLGRWLHDVRAGQPVPKASRLSVSRTFSVGKVDQDREETVVTHAPAIRRQWPRQILYAIGLVATIALAGRQISTEWWPSSPVAKPNTPSASNMPTHPASRKVVGASWQGWPVDAPSPATAPFPPEAAAKFQQVWAHYLNVPVEFTNSLGMRFRLIPPGEYWMGTTVEEGQILLKQVVGDALQEEQIRSESPQRRVAITRPFYLAVHETTQQQYVTVMGENPSAFLPGRHWAGKADVSELPNCPADSMTHAQATAFCTRLAEYERRQLTPTSDPRLQAVGTAYRLPTEAEWEMACRAGSQYSYWFGQDESLLEAMEWTQISSGQRPHPVGLKAANPYGLYDLQGNVTEWVADAWSSIDPEAEPKLWINPLHPQLAKQSRGIMTRGGTWSTSALFSRSAYRKGPIDFHRGGPDWGLRVALSLPTEGSTMVAAAENNGKDPDRTAAEWVLSLGGTLEIVDLQAGKRTITSKPLPETPFFVTGAEIRGHASFRNHDLRLLAGCRGLSSLSFGFVPNLTDVGLQNLRGTPLKSLSFYHCPSLTDRSPEFLSLFPDLEFLQLGTQSLTDAAGANMPRLNKLQTLKIIEPKFTAAGLASLVEACPGVTWLSISGSPQLDIGSTAVFPEVQRVDAQASQLTDRSIDLLNAHPSLKHLVLDYDVSDETIVRLGRLTRITQLFLQSNAQPNVTRLTPGIYGRSVWPDFLHSLYFVGAEVAPTDDDLVQLAGIADLQLLVLDGQRLEKPLAYSAAGIARFRELRPDVAISDAKGLNP